MSESYIEFKHDNGWSTRTYIEWDIIEGNRKAIEYLETIEESLINIDPEIIHITKRGLK